MIDIESIKKSADLLLICGRDTTLKRKASTNGGEWSGPCPFCKDGKDRFYVQPYAQPYPRWACRVCTPKGDSVLGYIARRDGLDCKRDFIEICNRAAGGNASIIKSNVLKPQPLQAIKAPDKDWQRSAKRAIEICQTKLWNKEGSAGLGFLRRRGLQDRTIQRFNLGYSPGVKVGELWIPAGVVIPCIVRGEIWYVKVRILNPSIGENKYAGVKGNRSAAIYNADDLGDSDTALFCEGEFDCLIAWQELNNTIPCVTMGSASNSIDTATWGVYLLATNHILAAYDNDEAGEKGLARLFELAGQRVNAVHVPYGKDINDFYKSGGDLFDWIKPYLPV